MKFEKLFRIVLFIAATECLNYQNLYTAPTEQNWWQTINQHMPLVDIFRGLLHIPSILSLDSQNKDEIETSSKLALAASQIKILHSLTQSPYIMLTAILYDIPKLLGYGIAGAHDVVKFNGSEFFAQANSDPKLKATLSKLKKIQLTMLGVETIARGILYAKRLWTEKPEGNFSKFCDFGLQEFADIMELCRLLSRFTVYHEIVQANMEKLKKDPNAFTIKYEPLELPAEQLNHDVN